MVVFQLQKHNDTLLIYTVRSKELLFIVTILSDFCTMLLDTEFHIHINHPNINTCQYQLHWKLNPYIHFTNGNNNNVGDISAYLNQLDEDIHLKREQTDIFKDLG